MASLLALSAFVAAALAFAVQPIVARMLLSTYGGSAAVWTTALVFFQVALVAGYAWAHVGPSRLGSRRHAVAQVVLVGGCLLLLPITLPPWAAPASGVPTGAWLAMTLAAMVGLPFLVLAANGPTVQRWFAASRTAGSAEPYRLFAASNAGSLIGLLAYPLAIEPNLDLVDQARWWAVGFGLFVVLTAIAAWGVWRTAGNPADAGAVPLRRRQVAAPAASPGRRLRWLALAGVPTALMVGVTGRLSTDVAAVPFLWVLPLSIYLVTLILAFARTRPILATPARIALLPLSIAAALLLTDRIDAPILGEFGVHLGLLLAAGLALHGDLAADRPAAERLTEYTLLISIGGAVGGLAAGLAGPLLLPLPLEEAIALVAAVSLAWASPPPRLPARRVAGAAMPALVGLILIAGLATLPPTLATVRTFYGTYRVVDDGAGRHVLYAGTTIHGIQDLTPGEEREPWSYYSRRGPLGQVLASMTADPAPLRIGAVGLGSGAVAAYGRPGDRIEFLEIDPAVVRIATDRRLFTYLADAAAEIRVDVGDGRLLLERRPAGTYDLLVLDAFSSDAVPVHLLTVEGLASAMRTVRDGGVIAFHVSNRYLDLEPVVAAAARDLGFVSILGSTLTPADEIGRAQASQWVVVGRAYRDLAALVSGGDWRTAHAAGRTAWTDRFSDLLGALRRG
jgi:hypothetical protein